MSPHVFLVAGEESGDRLGAALIAAIKRRRVCRAFSLSAISRLSGFLQFQRACQKFSAVSAKRPMPLSRPNRMSWSSSTVQNLPIVWRDVSAPGRAISRSLTTSAHRSGPGGRVVRARCANMWITCSHCSHSSRRSWVNLVGHLAAMSVIR